MVFRENGGISPAAPPAQIRYHPHEKLQCPLVGGTSPVVNLCPKLRLIFHGDTSLSYDVKLQWDIKII